MRSNGFGLASIFLSLADASASLFSIVIAIAIVVAFAFTILSSFAAVAGTDLNGSPLVAHPIAWMHQLPSGETPGWSKSNWFNLQVGESQVWNAPTPMINLVTKEELFYKADFQQTHYSLDLGFALSEQLALEVEGVYTHRYGGSLDNFIDEFHRRTGSNRYRRPEFPENQNEFVVQRGGRDVLRATEGTGFSNGRIKLRYWPLRLSNSGCPCGIGFNAQVKFPLNRVDSGLTSGGVDASGQINLGVPIGETGGLWFTGGLNYLGENKVLNGFPREHWLQLYELNLDVGFSKKGYWGLVLQAKAESPFLDRRKIEFLEDSMNRDLLLYNRIGSGWNALSHWRGSQSFGIRYRPSSNFSGTLWMLEDFGIGDADKVGNWLYVNNAPDVAWILHLGFSI